MRGRIFICAHQPMPTPWDGILYTSSTIHETDDSGGLLATLGGRDLDNRFHSELCHQHRVWKTSAGQYDFVGFEHYRRSFLFNPFSAVELQHIDPMVFTYWRHFLSHPDESEHWLGPDEFVQYDAWRRRYEPAILQCIIGLMGTYPIVMRNRRQERMDSYWKKHLPMEWWELFVPIVHRTKFFRDTFGLIDCGAGDAGYGNMYVMRTEVFVEYMAFWEETMLLLEEVVTPAPRIFGYFAEFLVNMFVYGKRLKSPNMAITDRQVFLTAKEILDYRAE